MNYIGKRVRVKRLGYVGTVEHQKSDKVRVRIGATKAWFPIANIRLVTVSRIFIRKVLTLLLILGAFSLLVWAWVVHPMILVCVLLVVLVVFTVTEIYDEAKKEAGKL